MLVIKRDGTTVEYDRRKIEIAIEKANNEVPASERVPKADVENILDYIEARKSTRILVEDIQDIIEQKLMELDKFVLAKTYIVYRYNRALVRKANTTDEQILSLIECNNEEVKQENSNKNPTVNSVQRDYMAGEVSKDLSMRLLLPKEIVQDHNDGIIHFHDADYFLQHIFNCCLVNLYDMLQAS